MQFNQGDKAVCVLSGDRAEVQFGPVSSIGTGKDAYLVKWLDGDCVGRSSIIWTEDLEPALKFEVGQRVRFTYSPVGESFEVVAGPFPDGDSSFWVLKDRDGAHDTSFEKYIVPVVE